MASSSALSHYAGTAQARRRTEVVGRVHTLACRGSTARAKWASSHPSFSRSAAVAIGRTPG
eukprot:410093-Prymnesium_polylepis.1